MRAPESAETNFKWRPSTASAWYAGAVSIVEGNPQLSKILFFGDGALDKLCMVYAQGKVSEPSNAIPSEYVEPIKADVASAFGMQIETFGTLQPPVAPGEIIPDFADYMQISE